jgi:hypothetical protein
MYKVIKHDINRCYIPSASLQLQPLQTPQIHSIMATSFLMTTASSSINTASVLSHLPEDYIETAKGYIGSTWGDKALSSFITCTESADDYLRSSDFDDKTYETFKTRHAQLFLISQTLRASAKTASILATWIEHGCVSIYQKSSMLISTKRKRL